MITLILLIGVVSSLLLTVVSLVVFPVLALFLFFPLVLLTTLGVLTELGDRSVRQREPATSATVWRVGC